MQEDQNSQSTDNTASQNDGGSDATTQTSPTFSLGSNPSDNTNQTAPTTSSDGSAPAQVEDPPQQVTKEDDLDTIKKEALAKLAPIIDELDQKPEEQFRTLMLLIQSSDDQKLIKNAYDAANKIEDTKARAKALVAIVNEIEYFTHQDDNDDKES